MSLSRSSRLQTLLLGISPIPVASAYDTFISHCMPSTSTVGGLGSTLGKHIAERTKQTLSQLVDQDYQSLLAQSGGP
ncbi:hypothetical protein B0J15DRAFT_273861 [Fusarium solani]|uniref:Uncharacterized protein n=1 Tax=Fusarium solani TaxID=169388 RepID=A0A9P9KER8_FUSSL|nr:uncharacterized protein B0J15DRAFT_273861 [Fusarium solani]KAH7259932.1 hypothetical protein B0J15DRAFT_273861 [Fusarium solani]